MQRVVLLLVAPTCAAASDVSLYKVGHKTYTVDVLDSTSKIVDVYYPEGTSDQKFPLVVYAHGNTDGGTSTPTKYKLLFSDLAGGGYIVVAPEACNTGCRDDPKSLPLDPKHFGDFYLQQLKAIDWARGQESDPVLGNIDRALGAGVAGHSMGGQAAQFCAGGGNPEKHGISAAVMHHAFTHTYTPPTVPFLAFTGSSDIIALPAQTQGFFNLAESSLARGYVNKLGATHFEPNSASGPMTTFTVAWFKIYLDKTPVVNGTDYKAMIYGTGKDSLCHGGDGAMVNCTVTPGSA